MPTFSSQLRTNATDAEKRLWSLLRNRQLAGYKFRRQHPIPPYIVDFVCLEQRLVVELDGGQHAEAQTYDASRTAVLEKLGYQVLRFWNNELLGNTQAVLEEVLRKLEVSSK
jgi:very-short-patch-repair endonuclease